MSRATAAGQTAPRPEGPDIKLVPTEAGKEATKPQAASAAKPTPPKPAQQAGLAQPAPTLDDPWRHLHPARIWPD